MNRLRKVLQQFRAKVRAKVQAFVKYNWHNEPEGDQFRSVDVMLVAGGNDNKPAEIYSVRYDPPTKWRRFWRNVYSVLPAFTFLILVLNGADEIPRKFNLAKTVFHAVVVLTAGLCLIKTTILNQHFESIQTARNFVNGKPFASGDSMFDTSNDAARRKKCFQRFQLTGLVFLVMVLIDHVIVNASIPAVDELLGTPRILQHFGPTVAEGIHRLFLLVVCPLWFNKFCSPTGTICSLLHVFNTEYEIFVAGFGNLLDNVYEDVEEAFPSTVKGAPDWKRFQRDLLYWKFLEQRLKEQAKLHVMFVENLHLMKPAVKILFFIMYYHAMVYFSPLSYVVMVNGLSAASFLLASGVAMQLLECYVWCRLVDWLRDTNDKLELAIMELATRIPYSLFHRRKYAEIQMTLRIMKIFIRNHEPFSCGGVFPISVEAFTELLHVGYSVFTFLRDLGKKHVQANRPMRRKLKQH